VPIPAIHSISKITLSFKSQGRYLRLGLVWTFLLTPIYGDSTTAAAQQSSDLNELASQISAALQGSQITHFAVFDFVSQDSQVTLLGRNLGGDLSAAIVKTNPKLSPADRSRLAAKIESERLSLAIVQDSEIASWLGDSVGAQAFIQGKLSLILGGESLSLIVQATQVKDGRVIGTWKATLAATDEDRLANGKSLDPDAQVVNFDPQKGYTWSTCIRCPNPSFTKTAEKKHTQGTVMISAVVGGDGKARDILVTQRLADGLTLQAVEAVQKWTFRPARTSQGNTADVRMVVEVTFRLY
jgi:TonB family protein